jgi:hypothetical protein
MNQNTGITISAAHAEIQPACDARFIRRPPNACATNVCPASPTPPNSAIQAMIGQ